MARCVVTDGAASGIAATAARARETDAAQKHASKEREMSNLDLVTAASEGAGIGDDTLKDVHVAGWLYGLEPAERDRWLERVGVVRRVDQKAEAELLDPGDRSFSTFVAGWSTLRDTGTVELVSDCADLLRAIQRAFFSKAGPLDAFAIRAFDTYVDATRRCHRRGLTIDSCAAFEQMLGELSGSLLLCMPDAPQHLADEVVALGAVDQLYDDVRDLVEAAACGVCHFPADLLRRFDLQPSDFFARRFDGPRTARLLRFLVTDLGPWMRERYPSLRAGRGLHPTWQLLMSELDQRHDLVERTMIESRFDVRNFTMAYWDKARAASAARVAEGAGRQLGA